MAEDAKLGGAFVEIKANDTPLRAGLRQARATVTESVTAMSRTPVTVAVKTDKTGLNAQAMQVPDSAVPSAMLAQVAGLGVVLRAGFTAVVPVIARMSQQLEGVSVVATHLSNKLYDQKLQARIDATNNKMIRGLLQGVQEARKLQDRLGFVGETVGRVRGMVSGAASWIRRPWKMPEMPGMPVAAAGVGKAAAGGLAAPRGRIGSGGGGGAGGGGGGMLGGMLAGGAVAAGVVGLAKMAAKAGDLGESISAAGAVFGPAAGKITTASDTMAKQFGINKQEFTDGATRLGSLGKAVGMTQEQAAGMGVTFAKLGADLSSFRNISNDEALTAIASGLSGEAEPLRRYGVLLSEAAVKNQALSMGAKLVNGELSEQAKVSARMVLIQRGLADADGDLERTSGSYANQVRKLQGSLSNMAAEVGQSVLPAFQAFVGLAMEVGTGIGNAFQRNEGSVGGLVAAVKSGVETIGIAYRNWDDMTEILSLTFGGWIANAGERLSWLGQCASAVAGFLRSAFVDAFNIVQTSLANLLQNFARFAVAAYDYIASGFSKPFQMPEFVGLADGLQLKAEALKLPELKLSDNTDAIQQVWDRIVDRETKRREALDTKPYEPAGPPVSAMGPPEAAGKEKKEKGSQWTGIVEFAKQLQTAALGPNAAQETAAATKELVGLQKDANRKLDKLNGGVPAVAMA